MEPSASHTPEQWAYVQEQWDRVQALIDLLEAGYVPTWPEPRRSPQGHLLMSGPAYDPRVNAGVLAAARLLGDDQDYLVNIRELRERPVEGCTRRELATWFTYFARGERFSDGFLAGEIEAGRLLAALRHLRVVGF